MKNTVDSNLSVNINKNTNNHSKISNDLSSENFNENQSEIKGTTKTFRFIIPKSNDYEPFIIKIYELSNDVYIKNLYIDKLELLSYFSKVFKSITIRDIYDKNFLSQ